MYASQRRKYPSSLNKFTDELRWWIIKEFYPEDRNNNKEEPQGVNYIPTSLKALEKKNSIQKLTKQLKSSNQIKGDVICDKEWELYTLQKNNNIQLPIIPHQQRKNINQQNRPSIYYSVAIKTSLTDNDSLLKGSYKENKIGEGVFIKRKSMTIKNVNKQKLTKQSLPVGLKILKSTSKFGQEKGISRQKANFKNILKQITPIQKKASKIKFHLNVKFKRCQPIKNKLKINYQNQKSATKITHFNHQADKQIGGLYKNEGSNYEEKTIFKVKKSRF